MPKICLRDVEPNFAKSTKSLTNIAEIKASPGPVKTLPIPLISPCANLAPGPSPCNRSVIPLTTEESAFRISPAASLKPKSPRTEASF